MSVAVADPLTTARALAPTIDRGAAEAEIAGTIPEDTVSAIRSAGLLALAVPRALGGVDADLATLLGVYEELSRADGSTGWAVMAAGIASGFAAAYTGDDAAQAMFGGDEPGVHAGQFAPRGQAVVTEGGYRLSGQWGFASGSQFATWLSAGAIPLEDGHPRLGPDGVPEMLACFVPKGAATLLGNWEVMGLRATCSQDYALSDVFVGEGFTFPLLHPTVHRGGPLHHLGVLVLTATGHAAFALGVGRRALDELAGVARDKQRLGDTSPLASRPTFLTDLAKAEAALRSARLFVHDTFGAAWDAVCAGREPDVREVQLTRLATTHATLVATEAADLAYRMAGSQSLRNPSVLGRCFRDIHAATQHLFVDDRTWTDAGAVLVGVPAGS